MANTQNNVVWYNRADSALRSWAIDFGSNCSTYETELQIGAGDLEVIQDAGTAYETAMANLNTARAAYVAAVQAKDLARQFMIDVDRGYVAQFQAMPNLDPKILETLDVPQRGTTGSRSSATTPNNLVVSVSSLGDVEIKFNRNGNSSSAVFTVEQSFDEGATWSTAFSSTRTRVKLTGYTAGQTAWFRVYATRNGTVSTATMPVMIWPSSGAGSADLQIAA